MRQCNGSHYTLYFVQLYILNKYHRVTIVSISSGEPNIKNPFRLRQVNPHSVSVTIITYRNNCIQDCRVSLLFTCSLVVVSSYSKSLSTFFELYLLTRLYCEMDKIVYLVTEIHNFLKDFFLKFFSWFSNKIICKDSLLNFINFSFIQFATSLLNSNIVLFSC